MNTNEPTNTNPTTPAERRERCEDCFFCLPDMIPDPNAVHRPGMSKPKIPGHRCHICRPSNNGFPIVRADEFCPLWADRNTRKQPLVKLLSPFYGLNTTAADEIDE